MWGSSRLLSTRFLPTLTLAALTFTLTPGASLKLKTLQPIKTSHAEIRLQIVQGFELTHSEIRKWVSRSVEVIEQFYKTSRLKNWTFSSQRWRRRCKNRQHASWTGTVGKRLGRRPFGFYGLGA